MSLGLSFETPDGFTVTCWSADKFKNLDLKKKTAIAYIRGYKDEAAMVAGKQSTIDRQYALNESKCDFSQGLPVIGTNTGVYAYLKTLPEWDGYTNIDEE